MKRQLRFFPILLVTALFITACGQPKQQDQESYSLKTDLQGGKMVFVGVGGAIDGMVNPTLTAKVGDVVTIKLTSGEGAEHDIALPDFNVESAHVVGQGNSTTVTFGVDKAGTFAYFCNMPGHQQAGMEGQFVVNGETSAVATQQASGNAGLADANTTATGSDPVAPASDASVSDPAQAASDATDIVHDPADLPGPIGDRSPTTVRVDIEAVELDGKLDDGTTFRYWTFDGKVPGPFIRVRVGDTVEVHLKNSAANIMTHSIDFHAVTGPGGGSAVLQTPPGQEKVLTFKALHPGLFVYHCATPMVAEHIANGMFGMILVEPEGGLPDVDHEFYVMQNEIYTTQTYGTKGQLTFDMNGLLDEKPQYFVFNGAVGALTNEYPLKAKVGDTIRIYFGVGGPNYISSFHVIGEYFDKVYNLASLETPPMEGVQTTLVPPGGATVVEFKVEVPGQYILVDHALSRVQRGLAGYLEVEGPDQPDIYRGNDGN